MQLIITNNTAVSKSYIGGLVTLAGTIGATTTVTNFSQLIALATDAGLRSDMFQGNVTIGDGTNTFSSTDGITYLALVVSIIGPARDVVDTSFVAAIVSVGTTPVQVKAGASVLPNRKYARVQPLTGAVAQGSSNSITFSTGGPILRTQIEIKSFTDNVGNWYIVASSGTVTVYIEEGS